MAGDGSGPESPGVTLPPLIAREILADYVALWRQEQESLEPIIRDLERQRED